MLALLQNSNDDSSGGRAGSLATHYSWAVGTASTDKLTMLIQQIHYPGSIARLDDAKKGA